MKKSKPPILKKGKFFAWIITGLLVVTSVSCDFQSPGGFKLSTWFFDISFPLVQKRYSLDGLIDNKQIFSTQDSLGMQLVFEGTLPDTTINADILDVDINQNINYAQDPLTAPTLSVVLDTIINISIPMAPGGQLVDNTGATFTVPPGSNKTITGAAWNTIASAFDTTIQITINLPQIPASQLPDFVTSVEALIIKADAGSELSLFTTSLKNNGLPTDVTNINFLLVTDLRSPPKTLANHTLSALSKDATFGPETTSLGGDSLGNAIRMDIGFEIATTDNSTLTIFSGDSVKVDLSIRLKITGVDSALVQIAETDLPLELPQISFPSEIEIFSGLLKSNSGFGINEIAISNLRSTYPFDVEFSMNFNNFIPPAGSDSVKIDTTLKNGSAAISKTFNVDGYTFANPEGTEFPLSGLNFGVSASIKAQTVNFPLDGSDFGAVSVSIVLDKLSFQSLEANIIQEFPSAQFDIAGLPGGFSGMSFTDVKMEIEMLNGIRLPVVLNFDLIGINQLGDSSIVLARATLFKPTASGDTTKTIIRLSREGTTTLKYKAPGSVLYTDSVTVAPGPGESTIVELMSFNPASIQIKSRVKIDGRGTLEAGQFIGGSYRMITPFEVVMSPMTFLSVTNTPIAEMNHDTRNRIRSTLQAASLTGTVENKIPSGGEISILLSNKKFFPLDNTIAALSMFRDSMVVKEGWSPSDSLYIISRCDSLDPELGNTFIFEVMDDFSDCIDGLPYLVKYSGSVLDTVISYVDTLLKIPLPNPVSFYTTTTSTARAGTVREPGVVSFSSDISPQRIMLITSPGDHYTAPRFHLNGSGGKKVFLSRSDYIDINTSITFRLSSTGMMDKAPAELVIITPNGGETLNKNSETTILWKTYGSISKVDISYAAKTNPNVKNDMDWTAIINEQVNVDSFTWTPSSTSGINSLASAQLDSIRIRVKSSNSSVVDMSGWYVKISTNSGKIKSTKIMSSNTFGWILPK